MAAWTAGLLRRSALGTPRLLLEGNESAPRFLQSVSSHAAKKSRCARAARTEMLELMDLLLRDCRALAGRGDWPDEAV